MLRTAKKVPKQKKNEMRNAYIAVGSSGRCPEPRSCHKCANGLLLAKLVNVRFPQKLCCFVKIVLLKVLKNQAVLFAENWAL